MSNINTYTDVSVGLDGQVVGGGQKLDRKIDQDVPMLCQTQCRTHNESYPRISLS